MLTEYLREACGGDVTLFAKMLPDYPPFAKRFVCDNGILPATPPSSIEGGDREAAVPTGCRLM